MQNVLLKTSALICGLSLFAIQGHAQSTFELITEAPANVENEPAPVHPLPHDRQVKWMQTEFYAFYHYGMNTFTDKEWGNGDEAESIYAPTALPNPEQWLAAAKSAHMKGGIAVVKHHDGFCLWPTETTEHSIKKAGNANGKNANIPELFAAAAKKLDMKYGFYVSPWDRNSAYYGDGTDRYVTEVFLKQCKELAQYGDDQFEMWFDGANGGSGYYGGANTTRNIDRATYYDVPNLRDMVHSISPNCVLWGVGGEARWIGNEAGWAGTTNWCTDNREDGKDQSNAAEGNENGWMWLPGESDAKATTKGWFWHNGEGVQSAERLFQMYLETVGRNATWILNLPPDKSGSLPQATVDRMKELGDLLDARLGTNFAAAEGVVVTAENTRADGATRSYSAQNVVDGNLDTYYATEDGVNTATITIELPAAKTLHYVMLQEHIQLGQRVKAFTIETSTDGKSWTKFGGSMPTTTIGYKRIISQSGNTTSYGTGKSAKYVRVKITDCKSCPVIENIALY